MTYEPPTGDCCIPAKYALLPPVNGKPGATALAGDDVCDLVCKGNGSVGFRESGDRNNEYPENLVFGTFPGTKLLLPFEFSCDELVSAVPVPDVVLLD